jgi:hypothetical protein
MCDSSEISGREERRVGASTRGEVHVGRLDSSLCSCCTGTDETPWHVIGECNGADAVSARTCWADRMWDVLQKETAVQKGKTALRVDVANAVRRLWKAGAVMGGSLRGPRERPALSVPV